MKSLETGSDSRRSLSRVRLRVKAPAGRPWHLVMRDSKGHAVDVFTPADFPQGESDGRSHPRYDRPFLIGTSTAHPISSRCGFWVRRHGCQAKSPYIRTRIPQVPRFFHSTTTVAFNARRPAAWRLDGIPGGREGTSLDVFGRHHRTRTANDKLALRRHPANARRGGSWSGGVPKGAHRLCRGTTMRSREFMCVGKPLETRSWMWRSSGSSRSKGIALRPATIEIGHRSSTTSSSFITPKATRSESVLNCSVKSTAIAGWRTKELADFSHDCDSEGGSSRRSHLQEESGDRAASSRIQAQSGHLSPRGPREQGHSDDAILTWSVRRTNSRR